MEIFKYLSTQTVLMDEKLEILIKRWNLRSDYQQKSCVGNLRTGEFDYGEVPPYRIIRLLPECLVDQLIKAEFELEYDNGAACSSYDARQNKAYVKKTNDLLHEIGHAMWYEKILLKEGQQKKAVINSLSEDSTERKELHPKQIPTIHKLYAKLVGAQTGQFLTRKYRGHRLNDLEEHFARNFDYLLKGKPLEVIDDREATLQRFMKFYSILKIIDPQFEQFYRLSIQEDHKGRWCRLSGIREIKDGDEITKHMIDRVEELKSRLSRQ